jgi:hypothetical protein
MASIASVNAMPRWRAMARASVSAMPAAAGQRGDEALAERVARCGDAGQRVLSRARRGAHHAACMVASR